MGSLFSKPKAPQIKVQAPPVDNPIPEPKQPELGVQETEEQKKRKGKKGLKIDLATPQKKGVGTNIL